MGESITAPLGDGRARVLGRDRAGQRHSGKGRVRRERAADRPGASWAPGKATRATVMSRSLPVAFVLDRALAAYADGVHLVRATPDDWVTTAALSFIGAGIILQ
jgi:hypothetical protein